jgi:sec-independent protein translocase protein TatA
MGGLSIGHWLIVALVLVLVMGPSRLASSGKGLGEGIRNFRKGLSGDDDEEKEPKKLAKKTSSNDTEDDG